MNTKAPATAPVPGKVPITPTEEEWLRMTPDEREQMQLKVLDALSDRRRWTLEGDPLSARLATLNAKIEEVEAKIELALVGLRAGVLAVLGARGIECPDEVRAHVLSCDDPATLQRWLSRATTVGSAAEALFDEP